MKYEDLVKMIDEISPTEAEKWLDNVQAIVKAICLKFLNESDSHYINCIIQATKYNIEQKYK